MGIHRILVLGATFFLVVLSPHFDMALAMLVFGLFAYAALWAYDIFKGKDGT
jgi:hypothetical protein